MERGGGSRPDPPYMDTQRIGQHAKTIGCLPTLASTHTPTMVNPHMQDTGPSPKVHTAFPTQGPHPMREPAHLHIVHTASLNQAPHPMCEPTVFSSRCSSAPCVLHRAQVTVSKQQSASPTHLLMLPKHQPPPVTQHYITMQTLQLNNTLI